MTSSSSSSSSSSTRHPTRVCAYCQQGRAILKRPKTGASICQPCFFEVFETEIHDTIVKEQLFQKGERVAIGASGGKDSTVLAYVLKLLNEKYNYQLDLILLSIDEGITGYRDDSLESVKRNQKQFGLPLKILGYEALYGWTMDEIVQQIGLKNNCTFCGVFRRQALDRGAALLDVHHIVTGHNADDMAETVMMNLLRGDIGRLQRCTSLINQSECSIKRSKPFKYTYEKEIVMYAYFKKLDYFSTECIYSPQAFRGYARAFLKDMEAIQPSVILDIIRSGEHFAATPPSSSCMSSQKSTHTSPCERCGYMSSQQICKACLLLEGLNKGLPKLGIGKSAQYRRNYPSLMNSTTPSLSSTRHPQKLSSSLCSQKNSSCSQTQCCKKNES
ncbi:nucleotidyltransferase [Coelomomyces lativittatus]|nr:nucleotidyltransferase [Coelomomyces lativittatus]KAJ1504597.1 nucleotidyltransferase [Coelomomyces lativittatus]KAJ1510227.1 nucleotidyltransferase [Coelomomyces lativittatus]